MSMFERQNLKKSPRLAFQVTDHALERFRERVEEEFTHRSSDDLADLLNARISNAVRSGNVTDPRAPDAVTTLYLFECRTGTSLVAVVRDRHVVTVLDDRMAQNNYPGWDGSPTPGFGTIGAVLGNKLRDVVPVLPVALAPPPSDAYLVLAAECRAIAAKTRLLREHKASLEQQLGAVTEALQHDEAEFVTKRERLLTLMTEGDV